MLRRFQRADKKEETISTFEIGFHLGQFDTIRYIGVAVHPKDNPVHHLNLPILAEVKEIERVATWVSPSVFPGAAKTCIVAHPLKVYIDATAGAILYPPIVRRARVRIVIDPSEHLLIRSI